MVNHVRFKRNPNIIDRRFVSMSELRMKFSSAIKVWVEKGKYVDHCLNINLEILWR